MDLGKVMSIVEREVDAKERIVEREVDARERAPVPTTSVSTMVSKLQRQIPTTATLVTSNPESISDQVEFVTVIKTTHLAPVLLLPALLLERRYCARLEGVALL